MNWNGKLLCEISSTGEIFMFDEILLLIAFHLITVVKPYLTFSKVSCLRVATAILFFSKTWGPQLIDAMMCEDVHFGVQYTGHHLSE